MEIRRKMHGGSCRIERCGAASGAVFLIHRKFLPMNQNAPRGCAARGDEVYAEHTARARKCATSAHFILGQCLSYCRSGKEYIWMKRY